MKKIRDGYLKQIGESGKYAVVEPPQTHLAEMSSRSKKRWRKREDPSLYKEGDLRRIVAEGLAKSIDPYSALLAAGVIKSAAEFFDGND